MPPIRNACVARGVAPASQYTVVFTVPAGYVLLLKFIAEYNTAAAASQTNIFLSTTDGSTSVILDSTSVPAGTTHQWAGWTALNATDRILMQCTTNAINYWIAGALLPYSASLP